MIIVVLDINAPRLLPTCLEDSAGRGVLNQFVIFFCSFQIHNAKYHFHI